MKKFFGKIGNFILNHPWLSAVILYTTIIVMYFIFDLVSCSWSCMGMECMACINVPSVVICPIGYLLYVFDIFNISKYLNFFTLVLSYIVHSCIFYWIAIYFKKHTPKSKVGLIATGGYLLVIIIIQITKILSCDQYGPIFYNCPTYLNSLIKIVMPLYFIFWWLLFWLMSFIVHAPFIYWLWKWIEKLIQSHKK